MISLDAQRHLRRAAGRVGTAFAFGAGIATPATWIGTRDLESYEHVFFSLDRGTAARVGLVFLALADDRRVAARGH